MPNNFLATLYYILGIAFMAALFISIVAFTTTVFVLAFTYIFIPLLAIAGVRWLWLKLTNRNAKITYYDHK